MGRGCLALAAFGGGFVGGYVLSFAVYVFFTGALGWFDREGAWAMGVAFTIGPFVGLVCGAGLALWALAAGRSEPPPGGTDAAGPDR